MSSLFSRRRFAGFGLDRLRPSDGPPAFVQVRSRSATRLRQYVRLDGPRRPGVYGMLDHRGFLVYVGKAKCLRSRLLSYFRPASRATKAGRILEHTRILVWEPAPSEFAALLRELELIQRWRPRYNVLGVPGRQRFAYVCLGRKPAPYVYATRRPTGQELACFGPVPGGGIREGVRRLNDLFRLRDCPQRQSIRFAERRELFPSQESAGCLRYEIGTCLGPCAGLCTQSAYATQLRAARDFLAGKDTRVLDRLAKEMARAAGALAFEQAAAIRDKQAALQWLADRLGWLRAARQTHSFLYPVADGQGPPLWYIIHRGRVCAALAEPRDSATRAAAAALIEEVYATPEPITDALPADQVDSVLLVASWFRRYPQERAKLLTPAEALARCRAG